eukprot:gene25435-33193_t
MKPKTAILLPGKPLYYPEFTKDLHYECELVVRISSNGKFIQEKFAHKYYDAMTLGIDYTARDVQREQQKKGLPWEIAKAFDGSAVVGTFAKVTEETDMTNLQFRLEKNGDVVQTGDLLFTGTPAGVGPVAIGDKLEGYLMGDKGFSYFYHYYSASSCHNGFAAFAVHTSIAVYVATWTSVVYYKSAFSIRKSRNVPMSLLSVSTLVDVHRVSLFTTMVIVVGSGGSDFFLHALAASKTPGLRSLVRIIDCSYLQSSTFFGSPHSSISGITIPLKSAGL